MDPKTEAAEIIRRAKLGDMRAVRLYFSAILDPPETFERFFYEKIVDPAASVRRVRRRNVRHLEKRR